MVRKYKPLQAIGTYKLTVVDTGQFYVGSSGNLRNRMQTHIGMLRLGTHNSKELQEAYDYCREIEFEVICSLSDREKAYDAEQALLDVNANNAQLLNTSLNARAPRAGSTMPEEHKSKLVAIHKGAVRSEETRRKFSEARLGKKLEGEPLRKLQERNALRGKQVTIKGNLYPSIAEASRSLKVTTVTAAKWAKKETQS